jgi:hypothetical protein
MWLFVERQLEEAARKGAFDNLPGAGTPIDLTENPFLPPDWRLAFKILGDHKIVPEFVERRKEIETIRGEIDALKAAPDRRSRRLAVRNRLVRLAEAVEALNRSLARENQFVRGSLQLPPIDLEAELRAFDELV